jgi:cellulose 1,4-beta-cellobiosidase
MTILDRSSGSIGAATTTWTVTRSTGSYGTGTKLAVVVFGNTTFGAQSGWTSRASSVVNLGLYAWERTLAGETSFNLTAGVAGTGQWWAWELSSDATFDVGNAVQANSNATSQAVPSLTPAVGARHMLAVVGGTGTGSPRAVSSVSNSYVMGTSLQSTVQDWVFSVSAERDVTGDGSTAYTTTGTFSGTAQNSGGVHLAYSGSGVTDTTPPSVPTGLTNTGIGSTTADFSWVASTDNVAVAGYEVQITGP